MPHALRTWTRCTNWNKTSDYNRKVLQQRQKNIDLQKNEIEVMHTESWPFAEIYFALKSSGKKFKSVTTIQQRTKNSPSKSNCEKDVPMKGQMAIF